MPSTKSCYEKNISYFGRFDEKQKLSSKLMDLFENNKMKLNFISDNVPNEIKTKYKFINFISPKNHDDAILKFKQYASALILISEYEGLPIVCLEALNLNIPLILRDSFETAKFLINGGKNGFLLPKEYDEQKYVKLIKELNINKIKKNDLEEFNKLISEKKLYKKWTYILCLD